ncbi:type II toxin-antitoxin system RelE family toxin [Nocardiopsis composta]|uniref:mRNA interferase RelE/StbE n=1 Tax=Nocardiopsis composta TaxID=157465 RepID=A0A7W8QMM8_9ACTN|nr:type II toxin-antitoxin system RelE/ParE family toxin [Nocardiopsis composta]MBB5433277.1 mRNA interferase RelE/StbE [Nocardiopsis composta]
MTGYKTVFRPEARAELRELPRGAAMGILRELSELEGDPFGFNTTALVGDPDLRRLRVGDYRVVYSVEAGRLIIWVMKVGRRSSVYE